MKSKPMSKRAECALRASIKRWEKVALLAKTDREAASDYLDATECRLCNLYMDQHSEAAMCKGCPIMQQTGQQYCDGTPYYRVIETQFDPRACNAEVEFLKSMLPKEVQQ